MKVINILEDVTSIDSFKQKKRDQAKEKVARAKDVAMNDIDHAVARTIDVLSNDLGPSGAQAAVYQHLSDLIMAYDLEGGMYD